MFLPHRSTRPETMDDATLDPAVYARCLADLAAVNRITRTHAGTLRWLSRQLAAWPPGRPARILDVACGHGDLLRAIARRAARDGWNVALAGIDRNPRSALAAAAATPADWQIAYRTGDVFADAPDPRPDFIVTSQFTHHLTDAELRQFLLWLHRYAAQGWMITDLQRHILPYLGFRLLARAAGWHRIVRVDGTISIARGFHRADWARALAETGIAARIAWEMPFRFCVAHGQ